MVVVIPRRTPVNMTVVMVVAMVTIMMVYMLLCVLPGIMPVVPGSVMCDVRDLIVHEAFAIVNGRGFFVAPNLLRSSCFLWLLWSGCFLWRRLILFRIGCLLGIPRTILEEASWELL